MTHFGKPVSGKTDATDSLLDFVKAEAAKSNVGIRHLEGPAELAQRVLLARGVAFSYRDGLHHLITLLQAKGGK